MTRSRKAGIGAALALVLAFGVWWFGIRSDDTVFASVIPAVETTVVPPQYSAEIPGPAASGLVIRSGAESRIMVKARQGVWLNDGRYLFGQSLRRPDCSDRQRRTSTCSVLRAVVFDPRAGTTTKVPGIDVLDRFAGTPGEALYRVAMSARLPRADAARAQLVSLRADLSDPMYLKLPEYDGDVFGMYRNFGKRVYSIGSWDYISFNDTTSESDGDYGYLRRQVGSDRWEKVLLNQRLASVWVSSDGRALLAVQERKGRPCSGCGRAQRIVEIDPVKAEIAATYAVPEGYDRSWRVADVDKADDRVLVRFVHTRNVPVNLGVWQYDGDWSLVPGTDGLFTWWQSPDDRIEAQPPKPIKNPEDFYYDLYWVHDGKRTLLKGKILKDFVDGHPGIPGSLVPLR